MWFHSHREGCFYKYMYAHTPPCENCNPCPVHMPYREMEVGGGEEKVEERKRMGRVEGAEGGPAR